MINMQLINALTASNSDQAVEDIVVAVRDLGLKYDLPVELLKEIGDMLAEVRHKSMQDALELATIVLADGLGVRR